LSVRAQLGEFTQMRRVSPSILGTHLRACRLTEPIR
jgi:hypothetical protein